MEAVGAITDGRGHVSIEEFELGDPGPSEVRVAIRASGVCHTDYDCMTTWGRTLLMGHEGAGVVDAVGDGVSHVVIGDHVLLNWAIPCGSCFQCQRGAENICENQPSVSDGRFQRNGENFSAAFKLGTMSTHTVVPKQACVPIPKEVPFSSACIAGCGIMTGWGSVNNAAKVQRGSKVVVLGTGGVGLSVIQGAVHAGAGKIIAVDINPTRLELARQFGATHIVLADREDAGLLTAAAEVKKLSGGRGADYAFECTAIPELGPAPLSFIRNGGMAVGVSGIEQIVPFNMELFEWDKLYINPLYGQCRPFVDFPVMFRLYQEKRLKLDEMVTRTYKLHDLPQAFEDMHKGINAKGVLLMD